MKKSIVFLFMSSVLLFSCGSDDDAQEGDIVEPTPTEESQEKGLIGRWELVMDILRNDTTFYESGSGYVEFAKSGECHWTTKRYSYPDFANVTYTFDDENVYYILRGGDGTSEYPYIEYPCYDCYEFNEDSTLLKMWNLLFYINRDFVTDPKVPISVYRKK